MQSIIEISTTPQRVYVPLRHTPHITVERYRLLQMIECTLWSQSQIVASDWSLWGWGKAWSYVTVMFYAKSIIQCQYK